MYRHLLILPDGREIGSGAEQETVLQWVKVTQTVNNGEELTLGSVCTCEMQAGLIAPGGLSLAAGDIVTLLQVDKVGNRQQIGIFWLEKPVCPTTNTVELTAYDSVNLLNRDLTDWLRSLDQWPYSVSEFANLVCEQCGLILAESAFPNGDFFIERFEGEHITGRHLMQWLGQITGRFCRARTNGILEFAWYTSGGGLSISPTGEDGVFYYQGELEHTDYAVMPIEKVQLRESSLDIGTIWPVESGVKNTYIIENNPMLAAINATSLLEVAKNLFNQLQTVNYTPCRVVIPAMPDIKTGDILQVTDISGKVFTMWVMKKISDGQRDTLECTGSHRRDSTTAVNNLSYQALSGKVLNLRMDVDGLKLENRDKAGKMASVELDISNIRTRVESQEKTARGMTGNISSLTQTAQSLQLELETIRDTGTQKVKTGIGYTFDDKGLQIARTDSDIENLLDHTGMYVKRSGETVLQANNQGVEARDVTVHNYLIVGEHTRFEDYEGDRTACFYLG